MRPAANDSLYRELYPQDNAYEYDFPLEFAIRPLTIHDLDQAIELETKGFPENERASREKLEYRLKVCPELCCGVFMREFDWTPTETDKDDSEEQYVVSQQSNLKSEQLVAHIIATKTASEVVDDKSMLVGGHDESGQTIAIHSVVVDPEFQKKHFGHTMLKDYIQKFFALYNADRMSLLAHPELENFYGKHGFKDMGVSKCEFGGVKWHDFVLPIDEYEGVDFE